MKGREEEAVTCLARIGYEQTIGFLQGGFDAWRQAGSEVNNPSPQKNLPAVTGRKNRWYLMCEEKASTRPNMW